MRAMRSSAALFSMLLLTLMTASCDRAADAQQAAAQPPEKTLEVLDEPDLLISTHAAGELTMNGVRLGDDVSAIPQGIIKSRRDNHLDCANASYTIINNQVWAMTLVDRQKLALIHAPQDLPELIQMRLGKADQIDLGENAKVWKAYWFASKRAVHWISGDDYTGFDAITICR